jgi:hypothetical protein
LTLTAGTFGGETLGGSAFGGSAFGGSAFDGSTFDGSTFALDAGPFAAFTGTLLTVGLASVLASGFGVGFSAFAVFADAFVPFAFPDGLALATGFTTFAGFLEVRFGDGLWDLAEALTGLDLGI